MNRAIVDTESKAKADLTSRTNPTWPERSSEPPFSLLTWDEFEVLCYLLIRAERPEEEVFYFGKTADAGRDIVFRTVSGSSESAAAEIELVQCKRYESRVDASVVKKDLAKVFTNVFLKKIPERPDRVTFYVVPGLTSGALDILKSQEEWKKHADEAVTNFWKVNNDDSPPSKLLDLAKNWWPVGAPVVSPDLSLRLKQHPGLVDYFFSVRKVVDADSLAALTREVRDLRDSVRSHVDVQVGKELTEMHAEAERRYPGLVIQSKVSTSGMALTIRQLDDAPRHLVGNLLFPSTEAGQRGEEKYSRLIEHGVPAELEPGEYSWTRLLKGRLFDTVDQQNAADSNNVALHISRSESPAQTLVAICWKNIDSSGRLLADASLVLRGSETCTLEFSGRQLAGSLRLRFPTAVFADGVADVDLSNLDFNFDWEPVGRSLKAVRQTLLLWRSFEDAGTSIGVELVDSGRPLFESSGLKTGEERMSVRIDNTLPIVDGLEQIEQELGCSFSWQPPSERDLRTIGLLNRCFDDGAVATDMLTTLAIWGLETDAEVQVGMPATFLKKVLTSWSNGTATGELNLRVQPYMLFGAELDVGPFHVLLQRLLPSDPSDRSMAELRKILDSVEDEDAPIRVGITFERAVHVLERWDT